MMQKVRNPKSILPVRTVADVNHKNHKNLTINIHKKNADDTIAKAAEAEQEVHKLRAQLEERDKEIAALRQAAKVKDRKLDQLNNRCRKEQLRQYYRFMDLEPVVELEEDTGGGEESPISSGPPSLSPPPDVADMWTEDSYSGLLREHMELQRAQHALEARLRKSEARARQLQQMRNACADQLQQLQAEALELRELNELLEFRILELEEGHENASSTRSPVPDTRDVCTDTDNDDVSDSGVLSLATSEEVASDTDTGIPDLKLDLPQDELRQRVLVMARTSSCSQEHCCVRQIISLLEDYRVLSPVTDTSNDAQRGGSENSSEVSKPCNRIVATVLPFTEVAEPSSPSDLQDSLSERNLSNSPTSKLKGSDCLQESGIFDSDGVDWVSCGTQTEGTALSGDLSVEIQKLTQFRERIEEERSSLLPGTELASCRERLQLLEDKVRVYESNGEEQAKLLSERLQREVVLAAQAKEMMAKVSRLEAENARLEEERCELEEQDNDNRLRCQRLEVKLQALSERKSELHTRLQQERRVNTNLKSNLAEMEKWRKEVRYLESVLSKYEQRNYELEEREMELGHRLEMLEESWPVLLVWNIWRCLCVSSYRTQLPLSDRPHWSTVEQHAGCESVNMKLKYLEDEDMIGERQEAEGMSNASDMELLERRSSEDDDLQQTKEVENSYIQRIKELEGQVRMLSCQKEGIQSNLGVSTMEELRSDSVLSCSYGSNGDTSVICSSKSCMERVQELTLMQTELKSQVAELEQKEVAYMETLQQADDLWSELEADYQKQLQNMKLSERELRERLESMESRYRADRHSEETRVVELEQTLAEVQEMFRKSEEERLVLGSRVSALTEALTAAENSSEQLQREVDNCLKPQLSEEKRLVTDLQRDLTQKNETMESIQDSYETEIQILKCQLSAVKKEYMHANCECDQLKAEVQTLEKTIQDQREILMEQKEHNEKTLISLTKLLEAKDRELEDVKLATRDAAVCSAQEELREALLTRAMHMGGIDVEEEDMTAFDRSADSLSYDVHQEAPAAATVQPPPRTKRGSAARRGFLQDIPTSKEVSRVLDAAASHSKECSQCSDAATTAIQAIHSQVRVLNELLGKGHLQQDVPNRQQDEKRHVSSDSQGKPSMERKANDTSHKKEVHSGSHERKKSRWLTEVSINVNESLDSQTKPPDVKRSIMYWDDLTSQKNNSNNSSKPMKKGSRIRILGKSTSGETRDSPTI